MEADDNFQLSGQNPHENKILLPKKGVPTTPLKPILDPPLIYE
jgi:hypothetical protein